jgi:hypothetical protein
MCIVVYIWDDIIFEKISKKRFLNKIKKQGLLESIFKNIEKSNLTMPSCPFNKEIIELFFEKNWENIHVVNKEKLKKFLIYDFLPFPMLFSGCYEE